MNADKRWQQAHRGTSEMRCATCNQDLDFGSCSHIRNNPKGTPEQLEAIRTQLNPQPLTATFNPAPKGTEESHEVDH